MIPNKYPIYVVSKGRWQKKLRLTSITLEALKIPYYIVIEKQEYSHYASVIDANKILVLPQHFLDDYDTCDEYRNYISCFY